MAAPGRLTLAAFSKLFNLPNTVLGLALALPALLLGARASRGRNALHVLDHPLLPRGYAVTLGNVICFARDAIPETRLSNGTLAEHEHQHTLQGERLGPAYLPAHLFYGLRALWADGRWHGAANRLEVGPQARPPRPWA
jgi:hypothetical protein